IDEASMMCVPYVAAIGMLARERFIISGDFQQLPPIAVARSAAAYNWLHKDSFSHAGIHSDSLNHQALKMLQVQRRMHDGICKLINKTFYKGNLQTLTEPKKIRAVSLEPLAGTAAVFVELPPGAGSQVEQTELGSRLNRKSADVTAKLAKHFL